MLTITDLTRNRNLPKVLRRSVGFSTGSETVFLMFRWTSRSNGGSEVCH